MRWGSRSDRSLHTCRPRAGEAPQYFGHAGGNWGFRSNLVAHLEEGYGFVIMANADSSNPLVFSELPARIQVLRASGSD